MSHYSLLDVKEKVHPVDSLWTSVFINPLAARLTYIIANYTRITPNQITLISFLSVLVSLPFFVRPSLQNFAIGGVLFQIGFVFDCIDGRLARLKNISSDNGALYDRLTDSAGLSLALTAFAYGLTIQFNSLIFLVTALIYVTSYRIKNIINEESGNKLDGFGEENENKEKLLKKIDNTDSILLKIKASFWKRGIRMRFDRFMAEGLIFLITPFLALVIPAYAFKVFLASFMISTGLLIMFNLIDLTRAVRV